MWIVFDLDGTLIDSAPDLHGAASRMLSDEGVPPLPAETIRRFIGNGVPVLVKRIIAATGLQMSDHPRLVKAFLDHYAEHPADLTRPYPQVPQVLETLAAQGVALGICTNKPEAPARHILDLLGLAHHFPVVVGGDTYPAKKPDPAGLAAAIGALGGGPGLFVGDSEVDAETAQRAGVPFALFTEGYRKSPVPEIVHSAAFDSFLDLPGLAVRLAAAA